MHSIWLWYCEAVSKTHCFVVLLKHRRVVSNSDSKTVQPRTVMLLLNFLWSLYAWPTVQDKALQLHKWMWTGRDIQFKGLKYPGIQNINSNAYQYYVLLLVLVMEGVVKWRWDEYLMSTSMQNLKSKVMFYMSFCGVWADENVRDGKVPCRRGRGEEFLQKFLVEHVGTCRCYWTDNHFSFFW